jgi:hypothetical protein
MPLTIGAVFIQFPHNVDKHHRRVVGFDLSKNTRRHSSAAQILSRPMMSKAALRENA